MSRLVLCTDLELVQVQLIGPDDAAGLTEHGYECSQCGLIEPAGDRRQALEDLAQHLLDEHPVLEETPHALAEA